MLNLAYPRPQRPKCDGSSRREFLQIGTLGLLGLTLPDLLRARAAASEAGLPAKDTSVIFLFLDGGASQIETFDPKMDPPKEYRSIFGAVQTKIPAVAFGAQLPRMAALADRLSVLRTLTHTDGDHGGATHWMKTGHPWPPQFLGKAPIIPQQSPSVGSVVARATGAIHPVTGVPRYVRVLSDHGGYPGDDAVWLGQAYAPFRVGRGKNALLEDMTLQIDRDRLDDRKALLRQLDTLDRSLDDSGLARGMDGFQQQAVNVLVGRAREAFDLAREDVKTREKYGPGLGQELLLARRLCEAGAGFVTLNNGYWDHHGGIIPGLEKLCPALDRAVSAFLDDVRDRGLDRNILLLITGEFGRSPRIGGSGKDAGRDHWAPVNSAVLAGGGLRMGQVVGASDARAAYPKSRPITPGDFFATVLHALGIDPRLQFKDPTGRPVYMIEDGTPIEELI
jgi:hypothetical protein